MEDPGALDEVPVRIHLLFREADICAGLSVEREVPVPVRKLLDKGEGRVDLLVHLQAGHVDPLLCRAVPEHPSEHVFSDLSDKAHFVAKAREHREHVAGRAARVCLKERIPLRGVAAWREVDEELAECCDIQCLFRCHFFTPNIDKYPKGPPGPFSS